MNQLSRLFPNKVTIQLPQDEALLSDWKQQWERVVETMKMLSNVASTRTVSIAVSPADFSCVSTLLCFLLLHFVYDVLGF
ncbi:hypothetical protein K1719_031544 [Acacia pycnantha]|nr:hypothetical protein K1719_031544 [Acacia pycnantha]